MEHARIVGSPEKLADAVIDDVRKRIEARIREALEASRKIVDATFEEEYRRLESELRRAVRNAEEQLRAYTAKREVKLRKKVTEVISTAVEEIVEEAITRIKDYVGMEEYKNFMSRMLNDAIQRLKGKGRIVIRPATPDEQLIEELVRELGGQGVDVHIGEPVEGKGGFLASVPAAGLTVDYRLEVILAPSLEEARARIVEILRG
jgi:vacuolar-type H+-ATPase subunit E/Vma4